VPVVVGEAVQVTRKGGLAAAESPDGQWVYYSKKDGDSSLWKMPEGGGEETQVLDSVIGPSFTLANEGIYFVPKLDSTGRYSIQFLDFATQRIRYISTSERDIGGYLSVSPDGRWILYTQEDQTGSDLMLVENFR
jgi:Tol biopolymer transport system component